MVFQVCVCVCVCVFPGVGLQLCGWVGGMGGVGEGGWGGRLNETYVVGEDHAALARHVLGDQCWLFFKQARADVNGVGTIA